MFGPSRLRPATLLVLMLGLLSGGREAAAGAAPTASIPLASGVVAEDAFQLELRAPGECVVGQPATAQVVLDARSPYKVNQKYPYKFTFDKESRLKLGDGVVSREAVAFTKTRAVMTLRFVPPAQGPLVLGGEFKFSVCTDDRCLVERRALAVKLQVK